MPYTRTTYVNNTNPPLSAANANKSETGIQTAQAAAEAAQATASGAQAAAAAASAQAADAQTTAAGRLTQATADGLYVNVGEAINGGTAAAAGTALQHRSATAAQWTSSNPVLRVNELGVETDTNKLKVGTGATWTPTAYVTGSGGSGATQVSELSDAATVVRTTGDQGIAGIKTFSTIPLIGATDPTVDDHATRKGYVDTQLADKSDLAHGHNLSVYNAAGTALTAAPAIQFLGDAVATYNATSQRIEVNVPTTLSGFTFKATTQTLAASSTVAQDLTSLSFAVVALANYRIYFRIKHQSSATEHLQLTLTWPAGTTTLTAAAGGMWGYNTAGVVQRVVAHLTGATGAFRGTGTPDSIEGDIFLMVGNVAGTFQVQAAQAVSAVTQPLVQRSSFLEWARV